MRPRDLTVAPGGRHRPAAGNGQNSGFLVKRPAKIFTECSGGLCLRSASTDHTFRIAVCPQLQTDSDLAGFSRIVPPNLTVIGLPAFQLIAGIAISTGVVRTVQHFPISTAKRCSSSPTRGRAEPIFVGILRDELQLYDLAGPDAQRLRLADGDAVFTAVGLCIVSGQSVVGRIGIIGAVFLRIRILRKYAVAEDGTVVF